MSIAVNLTPDLWIGEQGLSSVAVSGIENLVVKLANTSELEQAFRLRYRVFVEEENNMRLRNNARLEFDEYDALCDHLIVKNLTTNEVIGTYRLLPGRRTSANKGFYSESEFDLSSIEDKRTYTLELGRSCIDPAYRSGRAIHMLWEGIAAYTLEHGYRNLIGCASVHMKSLKELNEIYSLLLWKQVITSRFGIQPLPTHRIEGLQWYEIDGQERDIMRRLPPLMKGYQWLGAEIGGDPAYDRIFDTVDFLIVLETSKVTRRYKKHFLDRS